MSPPLANKSPKLRSRIKDDETLVQFKIAGRKDHVVVANDGVNVALESTLEGKAPSVFVSLLLYTWRILSFHSESATTSTPSTRRDFLVEASWFAPRIWKSENTFCVNFYLHKKICTKILIQKSYCVCVCLYMIHFLKNITFPEHPKQKFLQTNTHTHRFLKKFLK